MLGRIRMVIPLMTISLVTFSVMECYAVCDEKDLHCSIPGGTRRVNGVDVKRDCWQYKYKKDCKRDSKDDCSKINHTDCTMVAEDCILNEEEGGLKYCGNLQRKFACERQIEWEEEKTELVKEGENIDGKDLLCASLCLDGNCDAVKKANMEEDNDMSEAAAMLNALKEAKKGIVGNALINIFKGSAEHCDRKLAGYTNCCTKLGGWGKMLGAGCSKEAKNLAKKRQEKKCVEIGTYCKTRFLGACIIKRTTFCCYDSIISKLINQEAKKQLGRNNGDAENPSCEGLVIDQEKGINDLENVDLSNIDFTEFYEEIVVPNINISNVKIDAKSNTDFAKDIAKKVKNMPEERKGFNEKIETIEKGNE